MDYTANRDAQNALRQQIFELRSQLRALQRTPPGQPVDDYAFDTRSGSVTLRTLFAGEDHLFVVHNMGVNCNHCTLWADGLNGLYDHLRSQAAFVVSSPDSPAVQDTFATDRGWRFPMVSHAGSRFAADMGYTSDGGLMPGVSVFEMREDAIVRIADAPFGEHDDFCALWPLFDMLGGSAAGWEPRLKYR